MDYFNILLFIFTIVSQFTFVVLLYQKYKSVYYLIIFCQIIEHNIIGYEPADLTVHPPPQNDRGWVHFFRMGV